MEDQASELRAMMQRRLEKGAAYQNERIVNGNKTRIIAVTSGKGGVGKSNIAVNMAIAYAQNGKRVILIDGDLGMANVNVLLGISPKANLLDVINNRRRMSEIITDTEFGFQFIPGANGFSRIANLSNAEMDFFASEFTTLSSADIIIIDTGAGIAQNVLGLLAAADEVYVVTTPEPTSITDAYGIIKIIATEMLDNRPNLKLLVNRTHSASEGKRVAERIITIVGQFLNYQIDYLGFIYDDPAVSSSVLRQKPFLIAQPNAKCSVCIKHIVGRIEKTKLDTEEGFARFFRKMRRKW
ncbi:MinD/ParA family protein [Treponema sp. OMZ 840]|uniref:MinD/ParA family protein n=1 Tax=Treponema sp. OMZ 840 TaxID=244313 RepID=UPI003D92DDD2